MKSLKLTKTLQIGLVATVLSTLPLILPVSAQVNPTTPTDPAAPTAPTDPAAPTAPTTTDTMIDRTDNVYENDTDWGWLGLLGLFGLLGLKRKPEDTVYRRDLNTDPTTTTRTDLR